jgi:hypothetical protein
MTRVTSAITAHSAKRMASDMSAAPGCDSARLKVATSSTLAMPFSTQAVSAIAKAPRERLSNATIRRMAGFPEVRAAVKGEGEGGAS